MSRLRKSAKGQPCMVRIPGVCNRNPDTTVLAHLNGGGMGMKRPDIFGAFSCSSCHDEVDRRTRIFDKEFAELSHRRGVERTQQWWLDNGFVGEIK